MKSAELKAMRRVVGAFIAADELEITLTRVSKPVTTNGSWIEGTNYNLEPQLFRVVPFKRRLVHQESNTQDGDIPMEPYVLVGRPNVDVQRDDEFTYAGRRCKIVGVEAMTAEAGVTDRIVAEFEAK